MAIDTKAKRASVQAYTFGLMRPPPDGVISASDRATVAWLYAGLFDAGLPTFINIAQIIGRRIVRMIAFDPVSTRKDVV